MKMLLRGLLALVLSVVLIAPASAQSLGIGLAIPQTSSGTSYLVIPSYYQGLTDEFEGSSTLITARGSNWSFPEWDTVTDATDPKYFQTDTDTTFHLGFLHANASNKNALHTAMHFGTDFGANFAADFGYDTTALLPNGTTNPANYFQTGQSFRFWVQDANNFLDLSIDPPTSGGRIQLSGKIGGSNIFYGTGTTGLYFINMAGQNLGVTNTRGNLHVEMNGCNLRVRLDNKWLWVNTAPHAYPYDSINLCAAYVSGVNWSTGGNNKGALGLALSSTTTATTRALAHYIRGRSLDIAIDWNDQFVGRDSNTASTGTARLEMTYYGTPVKWVGRLLNFTTSAVVKDWSLLANVTANGSNAVKADYQMPLGGLYTIEAGYIGGDGLLHTALSRPTAAGYLFATDGQSNSTGRAATGAGAYTGSITTNLAAAYVAGDTSIPIQSSHFSSGSPILTREIDSSWGPHIQSYTAGTFSSFVIAKTIANYTSIPVAVQVMGSASNDIAHLTTPGQDPYKDFLSARTLPRGICEAMIWDQGEADADYGLGPTPNYGSTMVSALLPLVRAQCNNPTMPLVISPFGRYSTPFTTVNDSTDISSGHDDGIDNGVNGTTDNLNRDAIRKQYYVAINTDPIGKTYMSSSKLGVRHPVNNYYHYTCAGCYDEINRRDGYTLAKVSGIAPTIADGEGPLVLPTATLSADRTTITLNLNMNGASTIVELNTGAGSTGEQPAAQANTVKGYQVTVNGFTTLLPIVPGGVTTDGSTITIVLASPAPAGTVQIRSFYGWDYDDTDLFYGHTYSDGRADIPVFPIINPVTAS